MLTSILAVVGVLLIGSAFLSVMAEGIAGNERFSLPFGNIVLVTLLGAVLFPFAGWISTAAVLGAYAAFSVMAGLQQRYDRPPVADALDAEPAVSRQFEEARMDAERQARMDDLGTKMLAIANDCVGPDAGWIRWIEYIVPELCRQAHETGRSWRWAAGEITPTAAADCVALAEQIGSWVNKAVGEATFEPFDPFPIPDQVARLIEIDQRPTPTPGPAGIYCIRCAVSELEILPDSTPRITFYSCSRCGRHYAKEPGQSLHDRLSPLSLVLYSFMGFQVKGITGGLIFQQHLPGLELQGELFSGPLGSGGAAGPGLLLGRKAPHRLLKRYAQLKQLFLLQPDRNVGCPGLQD